MSEFHYTLDDLEVAGFAVRDLPGEQQEVLCRLTAEEFALLVDIRSRLQEAGPEVLAHSEIAGAALF